MLPIIAYILLAPLCSAQAPVFELNKAQSTIGFNVKASVAIAGKFDKSDARPTRASLMRWLAAWLDYCLSSSGEVS
jgi:hypothetical protein